MPFLRKRPQGLGQQPESAHFQCRFPAFGDKTCPFNPDEIANIQQAKKIDQLGANFFGVNVYLKAARSVAQVQEMAFAHVAMRRDTPRGTKNLAFLELLAYLRDGSAYVIAGAERFDTFGAERFEFFAPQRDQFIFFVHDWTANVKPR